MHMLSSVSWQQFITTLIVLLFIYYFLVVVICYRKDLVQLSKEGLSKKQPVTASKVEATAQPGTNNVLFSAVHELMEELKGLFITASKNDYPKEELLMALQLKLRNYSKLKGTPLQGSMNNHIAEESKNHCEVTLTDQELQNIW